MAKNTEKTASADNSHVQKLENSLKAQAENLEKLLTEFKQMAQNVQQKSLEHSEPLKNSLKELTEQVSAIREYASHQQDRVERLQNGYDWNIIRSFCLRVIRCIDNIESRIHYPLEQNTDVTGLEEIRDELVFSLESSGVERFEPQLNSDYSGQEKIAEAIKEREYCDDPNMADKIAKVIRAGYQYIIDDENVRVVRPAQVKLFGQSNLAKMREN
jgi:molecular chaperone GrpE (heat shock protein)